MERAVKERLVGAAVLMAAAIILIPEMLSGPDREPAPNEPATNGDASIKTYTIDLNQAPGTPPLETTANVEQTPAPPPEEPPTGIAPAEPATNEPATQASTPAPSTPSPATPTPEPGAIQGIPESPPPQPAVVEPPTSVATRPSTSAPAASPPIATPSSVPRSGTYAVQVGSFARQATAERLARDLNGQGFDAFVMPVKSGANTLYRVRIGPMKDRASAEAALRKVKSATPGAAIVPHP